jgi:hypothetical protein
MARRAASNFECSQTMATGLVQQDVLRPRRICRVRPRTRPPWARRSEFAAVDVEATAWAEPLLFVESNERGGQAAAARSSAKVRGERLSPTRRPPLG